MGMLRKLLTMMLIVLLLCPAASLAEITYPIQAQALFKVNLREEANTTSAVLKVLAAGTEITVTGKQDDWYAVAHEEDSGYIREDLLQLLLADGTPVEGTVAASAADANVATESTPLPTATPVPGETTAVAAAASVSAASSSSTYRILRYGSKGEDVRALQQALKDLGYFKQSTTGNFYTVTRSAVIAFQKANGLVADGIAGNKTYAKLYGTDATASSGTSGSTDSTGSGTSSGTTYSYSGILRTGSRGAAVQTLQALLKQLGYAVGTVDGIFGSLTAGAVRSFQRANGLVVDGIAGSKTHQALYGAINGDSGTNSGSSGTGTQTSSPTATAAPSGTYRNLQVGSTGEDVSRLQQALIDLGYYTGAVTGTYDTATRDAVKAFQTNNDTGVDGVAGSATQRILYERTPRAASEGPVAKATLAPGVGEMSGPSTSSVQLLHWFNQVKTSTSNGQTLTVYDPASGLGWKLRIYARGNHCDAEPITATDTAIMYKAFGNSTTWNPKPVFVNLPDGRWSLASTHNVPHLTGSIKDNDFDGHLCVHFYRDMEEAQKNDPNYGVQNQNVIRNYWTKMGH